MDDRKDIYEVTDQRVRQNASSVVCVAAKTDLTKNEDETWTLRTQNYAQKKKLCESEKFRDQPTGAFCSGFLVAPDLVVTAAFEGREAAAGIVKLLLG